MVDGYGLLDIESVILFRRKVQFWILGGTSSCLNGSDTMREERQVLHQFIKDHPEIVITKNEISIPSELRQEFYRLFDDVRRSIVQQHYSSLRVDADLLSDQYCRIEKDIITRLGVERIFVPIDLFSFLHDPKEGLTRVIYNRLFDLLQGKITDEEFERGAEQDLISAAESLYRLGYEMWAALTIIKLLDPDEGFFVDLDQDYKPILTELKEIAFGRQAHHPTLRIPEFVIHSRRLERYVSIKMAMARELETFVVPYTPPVRPRRKTGDTSHALDSRVMLLYFNPTRDEIPIVAEIYERKLTSPDLMIEFITQSEFGDPAALNEIRAHMSALSPKSGISVLLIGEAGDFSMQAVEDNIQAICAGFDASKIEPVLERLAGSTGLQA